MSAAPENGCVRIGDVYLQCESKADGETCYLAFRPEEVLLGNEVSHTDRKNSFQATVKGITVGGFYARIILEYCDLELNALVPRKVIGNGEIELGTNVCAAISPQSLHLF